MYYFKVVILIAIFSISYTERGFASSLLLGKGQQKPLLVNIGNPNFRKMVMAIPNFIVHPETKSKEAELFAKNGPLKLSEYLNFSGLFNIISNEAYSKIEQKLRKNFKGRMPTEGVLSDPSKIKSYGVDLVQWKAIGVESLVVCELSGNKHELVLKFYLFDILRGKKIYSMGFVRIAKSDHIKVIRRIADLILETYTGKKGIFRSKIVFIGKRSKRAYKQVFICDFDGSNVIQITGSRAPHISPHFSPDGKYITFTSFERKNPDLYIYELATGKKRRLSARKGLNSGGQWAPNGKVIAFTGSREGNADIYVVNFDGSNRRRLITGHGLDVDPAFSPDQRWLAFVSGRFGNPHIFLGKLKWLKHDRPKVISDKRLTYAGWYNSTPSWSPDSLKLAFAGYDRDIDRYDIFMMNYDGTKLERLTIKSGDNESPDWSPNGQMIVFQSNRVGNQNIKGVPQLHLMSRDGTEQRKIDVGLYEAQTPDWSPALYD